MKKRTEIIFLIALILLLFMMGCVAFYVSEDDDIPEEGRWYCGELQMQIDFSGNSTYAIVDSNKILCVVERDRDSSVVAVLCQDVNVSEYRIGEPVFVGIFDCVEDDILVLRDYNTGQRYYFAQQ